LLLDHPWPGDLVGQENVHDVRVSAGTVELLTDFQILIGPRLGFAERITDQVRRVVDEFVTKIKLANQTP
jgi:hypothetical protein